MSLEQGHIIFQNTPDILDPMQQTGTSGRTSDTILHLLARAHHTALTGDQVVVGENTPTDFLEYARVATGQSPELLKASVTEPLFTSSILNAIDVENAGNRVLNPYIQWETVAKFSQQTGIPMAYTPAERIMEGLVKTANNKAYLRKISGELGIPVVPAQIALSANEPSYLADSVIDLANSYGGAFIQADLSGGGFGNVDLKTDKENGFSSGKLGDGSRDETRRKLMEWSHEMRMAGSGEIVIAPLLQMEASHTISGFIPAEGDPILYGMFKQVVDSETFDYLGFEWPAKDPYTEQYGQQMMEGAKSWFKHLQEKGYVGPSDVDYLIGTNPKLGTILAASESNTRWDAFRFGMQSMARLQGLNPRTLEGIATDKGGVYGFDHLNVTTPNTTELLERVKGKVPVLGIDSEKEGVVVIVPPREHENHYETALVSVGESSEHAGQIMQKAVSIIGLNR